MYKALPDEGALTFYNVSSEGKQITFYNALAANDPESSEFIWHKLENENLLTGTKAILLNTRQDRLDRARQLTEMIGMCLSEQIDMLLLIGDAGPVVENMAIKNGVQKDKILQINSVAPSAIFEKIVEALPLRSSIVAMGNMGGVGALTSDYFKARSEMFNADSIKGIGGNNQFFKN
jgi:hypothetical protein